MTVHALLDGPERRRAPTASSCAARQGRASWISRPRCSCAGTSSRLGVAPLTSMYWFSETVKPTAVDWRPEVHDSRRPRHVDRRRRAHLASAQQPAAHHDLDLRRQARAASACCSATATSTTTSTASATTAGPRSGSSRSATGARARCSSSRSRPTTRSTTTSSPCGCRPSPPRPGGSFDFQLPPALDGRRALPDPARPLRRDPPGQWRPGRAAARPRACASSWSSSSGEPLASLPFGVKPGAGALGLARQVLLHLHRGGAGRRARAIGAPSSTSPSTGKEPVEMRCFLRKGDEVLTETWLYQYHPPF